MRLFRQKERGNWGGVFERMAGQLTARVGVACVKSVAVPTAPGEALDKLTILQIKAQRIDDPLKLAHVKAERDALTPPYGLASFPPHNSTR
jgi:hypothetical protein